MIIALTGLQGVGKSTVMNIITNYYSTKSSESINLKFAQPLYDIQKLVYNRINRPNPNRDRTLLQDIGMWGRNVINQDIWVDLWKEEVANIQKNSPGTLILCDDMRFDNEAKAVKDMKGIILKIEATVETRAKRITLQNTQHVSELGISPEYVDSIIYNDGTKEELEWDVLSALESILNKERVV